MELRDQMVVGCLREAEGRYIRDLERQHDEFLIELMNVPAKHQARFNRRS